MTDNLDVIEALIIGRVRPSIYAFSTNTVPNYLKVGDTYRPVGRRLQEWRQYFPELEPRFHGSASISEDIYFRDHAVHSFLLEQRGRPRLLREEVSEYDYYSREFFGGAEVADIEAALCDIRRDYEENGGRYAFYDTFERLPVAHHYVRGPEWTLRPNQQAAVEAFVAAVAAGRSNLLMYAVMRFGKTFTSLMCAKSVCAEVVLVVSAKADVKEEWRQTVESAGNFDDYIFCGADALLADPGLIRNIKASNKSVVVFLTLQDLQGSQIKEKHAEIFSIDIDVLIIDETHFGARASSYGKVLRDARQPVDSLKALAAEDDAVAAEDARDQLKAFAAKTRLHLSGSPYRILMSSEFVPEDIVSFVQFADIVAEQEAWDRENPDENEWNNPYFGFPQMVRFAFNPNRSSQEKLAQLKAAGVSYALSALLEPGSVTRDLKTGLHKKFKNEVEILELLRAIDGSQQDENIFGFLDYPRIKSGEMCRHVVMVLPYRASCDAMEALIKTRVADFKNLGEYEVVNISGLDAVARYSTAADIKATIARIEADGRKSLTLTVNRMLTGSTVAQWDTMIYLKDTASPQEYDQATFRLQSQHLRTLQNAEDGRVIRENLKPQTLLVDFNPLRLFQMQEQRSIISNVAAVHSSEQGNDDLSGRLKEDLRISPVITMNCGKLLQVSPIDILASVTEYNLTRSIDDEARDVPVDLGLLNNATIRKAIEIQAEIGSRTGLTISAVEGEGTDLDIDEGGDVDEREVKDEDRDRRNPRAREKERSPDDSAEIRTLSLKLKTYYQRILFFAMLTPDPVTSLKDIVNVANEGVNKRIAMNLGLEPSVLQAIHAEFDPFKLNALDYKIANISRLAREESLSPIERASRALEKFTRISDSEVRTPIWLCRDIVGGISKESLRDLAERGDKILDVSSKSGEFAFALYERLVGELEIDPALAREIVYSIPTSSVAYEFTRRFYEVLGLNVAHVSSKFTSYDLLSAEDEDHSIDPKEIFREEDSIVKFGAVVGNPPYQESDGGAQQSARSIYPQFISAAKSLNPELISFVIPSRWYVGGKGLDGFRAEMLADKHVSVIHDFPNPETVFPETNNRGGVCYFVRDIKYDAAASSGTRIVTRGPQGIEFDTVRPLDTFGLGVFLRDSKGVEVVRRVVSAATFTSFDSLVSSRKPFGLEGNIVQSPDFHQTKNGLVDPVRCYGKSKAVGFVERRKITSRSNWIDRWKVLAPYANNIGTELNDDNQNAFVAGPGSACSETFLVIGADLLLTEGAARNLVAYMKSKFARFLHSMAKVSQHGTKATYRFIPCVDLSATSAIEWGAPGSAIDEQLFDLYGLTEVERAHVRTSIKSMAIE